MVGSVERIEQEIAALDNATRAIADEFYNAYSTYLTVLGQAVRQQLILASYHVCTQGYPESFLKLSYNQRQKLQQTLRTLAQQVQEEVLAQLHVPVVVDDPDIEPPSYPPTVTDELSALDLLLAAPTPAPSAQASTPVLTPAQPRSLTPSDLAQWREELEHAIATELRTASHAANRLLQQADILPPKLPEPVLEAAAKADLSDARVGLPNLLNLIVETGSPAGEKDSDDEPTRHSVMHIVAICLRLAEIEFASPTVTTARSKIRSLFAQLKTLGREYEKKQREYSIAEAQAAWRSSWTEE